MSNPQSRVFMVQKSQRFGTEPAEVWGPVVFLAGEYSSPFNTDGFMEEIVRGLRDKGFDPTKDYIALTGGSIPIALMAGAVLAMYPKVTFLLFDARDGEYRDRVVERPTCSV